MNLVAVQKERMSQSVTDGQKLPLACPRCQIHAGVPLPTGTQVESSSGSVTVKMRCLSCGHEWPFEMVAADKGLDDGETTSEMPTFRRKRDRRRA